MEILTPCAVMEPMALELDKFVRRSQPPDGSIASLRKPESVLHRDDEHAFLAVLVNHGDLGRGSAFTRRAGALDGCLLFAAVAMERAAVMAQGLCFLVICGLFDRDGLAVRANHGIAVAFLDAEDLLLGGGLCVGFRSRQALARRRGGYRGRESCDERGGDECGEFGFHGFVRFEDG